MFPAKIYVGQIAVVLGIVVMSTWGATYQSGIYGCQFQISASSSGGLFSSSNAYKGSGGRPICEVLTDGSITGGWQATFRMR